MVPSEISKMFLFLGNSCRCGVENKGGGSRRSRNRIAGGAEIDQVTIGHTEFGLVFIHSSTFLAKQIPLAREITY